VAPAWARRARVGVDESFVGMLCYAGQPSQPTPRPHKKIAALFTPLTKPPMPPRMANSVAMTASHAGGG